MWLAFRALFVCLSAALAISLSAWATAFAQARIGAAAAGASAEKPEIAGSVVIWIALPDTIVVMGLVVGALIMLMAPVK